MKTRTALLCLLAAVGLVASACIPPTTPTGLAPVAVATGTPTTGTAPLEVSFSSAGSSDPDGTITSYSWDFGDGSPVATTADATHTYAAGTFTATLTVTDNSGTSRTATVEIEAIAVNQSPEPVLVATPGSGRVPLTVAFTGSGSNDPDGSIAAYEWDFGDGATSNAADPGHTYTTVGTKVVTLTVTDDDGATATSSTTIEVQPNLAPTADATATPTSGKVPLAVQFSSTGSSDPDGSIASVAWDFGDGATSNAAEPTHTYTTAGTKVATLTVTDDNGSTDSTSVTVQVNANQAPTAVAGSNVTGGQAPLTVHFSSAGSSDPDGGITGYAWTFGDGNGSTSPSPTYTYSTLGTYTATLTVSDAEGATSSSSVTIQVDPIPNVPPTVVATAGATTKRVGLPISFSSSGTTDPDGTITSYLWDFGDGSSSTAPNPSKTYLLAGTYTPTLTVTDNSGAVVAAATETITIVPNAAPTAAATATPNTGREPLVVNFSSVGSLDTDGTIASYAWNFGDGSPAAATASASHTYATAGTYTAFLTVTDDFGATDTASVAIVVTVNQPPTAAINASPQTGARPLAVNFDGTSSADPEGTALTYAWDFGDGGNGTGATPSHTYAVGTYTATLVVTDTGGKVSPPASISITVYVDDDGDGSPATADCNDAAADTYPGAPDALDSTGKDTNCDGVDGVLSDTILVAPAGADSGTCGIAEATPCQTIAQGLARAASTSRSTVLLTAGSGYTGFSLSSVTNRTLRGGYGADFTSRSGVSTSTGGVSISSSTGVSVRDLTIVGPGGSNTTAVLVTSSTATLDGITARSGTASGAGSSAYGLRAVGGSTVTVKNSDIAASAGIAGTSGTTPNGALTAGTNGANGVQGQQTDPAQPGATGGGTGINNGGNGGNSNGASGSAGANGGAGGAGGCNNCRSNSSYSGGGAAGGKAGGNGGTGSHGSASTPAYGALYSPTAATNGGAGGNGGGGGGGGGGGQACDYWACAGERTSGGSGAKGGGGGQGGGGGTAGTPAGGSFAVYSQNSTVSIDANTVLATANGGTGGNGAAGQAGATGGSGGTGGSGIKADCCTGTGGAGGSAGAPNTNGGNGGDGSAGTCCNGASGGGGGGGGGGNGGTGGTGGGGAGGPSIAMLSKGTGGITFGGNLTSQVTIGSGGAGGAAPNGGNAGTTGVAAKSQVVA